MVRIWIYFKIMKEEQEVDTCLWSEDSVERDSAHESLKEQEDADVCWQLEDANTDPEDTPDSLKKDEDFDA